MKHFLISILLVLSSVFGLYGSVIMTDITVSNSHPVVGEMVTFTLTTAGDPCSGFGECLSVPNMNNLGGVGCEFFSKTDSTITQTYNEVGVFPVSLTCEPRPSIKIEDGSSSNKSNATPAPSWILTNSTGSIPKLIVVSAPAPASAAVPTLSEWGLIILAIGMLLFGIVAVRQRSTSGKINY